jgi:multimeric flavodoxin WrbA
MKRAIAINGSPRKHKGNTAMILTPFIEGMAAAGCEVKVYYAKDLNVKSCNCPDMYCWYNKPGKCCLKDDMDLLYPKLREAEILILATPVYIPLPGEMQNIINRLCPLMKPMLEFREGRTRAMFRQDVRIGKILLVSTGGWWEEGNFGTVTRIARELAEDASVEFSGAIIRPHAFLMKKENEYTEGGKTVIAAAKQAGTELVRDGVISQDSLDAIKHPLIPEEKLRAMYNSWLG